MTVDARVRPALRWLPIVLVLPALRGVAVRYSVPSGSPWLVGCVACGAPVGLDGGLGPVGRCGSGRARGGAPPVSVAPLGPLGIVGGVFAIPGAVLPAYAWWAVFVVPLVLVDLAVHRLPDRLTLPAAAGVAV